jgi:hypothetical protein
VDERTKSFYSGVRTALAVIRLHGEDTIFDEVMDALGGDVDEFVQEAKNEGEYEFAGLDAWEKRNQSE